MCGIRIGNCCIAGAWNIHIPCYCAIGRRMVEYNTMGLSGIARETWSLSAAKKQSTKCLKWQTAMVV